MRVRNLLSIILSLVAVGLLCSLPAGATAWDKQTKVTFSEPVEVPGAILPAGTYEFILAAPNQNRSVVQIWNEDHTKLYTTFIAINNYRLTPSEKTVITFSERPREKPVAIHEWFYPGENFGKEFVYPEDRAFELAAQSHELVLAMPTELKADLAAPITSPTQPEAIAMEESRIVAVTPEQKEVPASTVTEQKPARTEIAQLPQTASSLPALLLLGVICMLAAFLLHRVRLAK